MRESECASSSRGYNTVTVQVLVSHATYRCDHKKNSRGGRTARVMCFIIFIETNTAHLDVQSWLNSQNLIRCWSASIFFACEGGKEKKLQSYWTVVSICQGIFKFILDILVENKRRKTGWMKSKLWHVLIMQSNIWDALDLSFYNNEKKVEGSLQDVKFAPFSGLIKVRLTLQLQFLSNFSTGMNQVSWI